MTPKPVVQGLLLCDYFIVEEGTGKASPIGCFSSIGADRFPSVVLPFSVVCFLSSGRGDGIIRLVISSLDTLEEIYVQERVISFPDRFSEVRYHFRVRKCSFPDPGWYQVCLWLDGELLSERRMGVFERKVME